MSLWSRVRSRLGSPSGAAPGEADASPDAETARSRATGGVSQAGAADTHSTTGTTPNDTFVGRASGDDAGDAGTTGAEARAEDERGARRSQS